MTSRKRSKGKERKAKKALELEKAKLKEESRLAGIRNTWQSWARGMDCRGRSIECNHGISLMIPDEDDHPVTKFIDGWFLHGADDNEMRLYLDHTLQTHPQVWNNKSYREMAARIFISIGSNFLICNEDIGDEDAKCPNDIAITILHLENYDGSEGSFNSVVGERSTAVKMRELYRSSRRDVLKYYRKRTICKCLKRMHLEARKACPKMGTCNGCLEEKERALLMVCSRCGVGQYCSRACQVSDWSNHRRYCDLNEHWQHANKR